MLALAVAVCCAPAVVSGQVRLGPTFRVNAYTTHNQIGLAVATLTDGGFVIAWASGYQDGNGFGVYARIHDEAGVPLGAEEFRVNGATPNDQHEPSVAALPGGSFVVVWMSQHTGDHEIRARRFDAAGTPGVEVAVNTYTTEFQAGPAVAAGDNGEFVVVWHSSPGDGDAAGVFGRRYDGTGAPLGPEFRVNSYTTGSQYEPSVAMGADGRFVVVWTRGLPAGDIHGQRFDATGAPAGAEFRVNLDTSGQQQEPSVAMGPDGGFVVVWTSFIPGGRAVFGRRFDPSGTPLGADFEVQTSTSGSEASPTVAVDSHGRFVVVWKAVEPSAGVFGRRFDAEGNAEMPAFSLRAAADPSEFIPLVAADPAGDFVTVWSAVSGTSIDVFAQRFRPDVIFKDGFDTAGLAAWSSSATDGGDLSTSVFAAMKGTPGGLRGVVDDTAGLFVQDDSPDGERVYVARFYLDPNGFDPGEAQQHFRTRVFIAFSEAPNRRVAAIVLRRLAGAYSIRARARLDDNVQEDTPFIPIDDGPQAIELHLRASSGPETNGGRLLLFIDGQLVAGHIDLDNSLAEVDFVRLGALSVKAGASGTLYWDEFESRRQSAIGP